MTEGTTTASVTFANPTGGSGGYTYSYDFSDSGNFNITGSTSPSATIPESYVDDSGTVVVHGRIADSAGGYTDYTTGISITDVAPTPTITPPTWIMAGAAGTFTGSATSPTADRPRAVPKRGERWPSHTTAPDRHGQTGPQSFAKTAEPFPTPRLSHPGLGRLTR